MAWHNDLIKVGKEGVTFKWPAAFVLATLLYGGQYIGLSYQSRADHDKQEIHNREQDAKIVSLQDGLKRCEAVQSFLVDEVTDLNDKLNKRKVAPNITKIAPITPSGSK